MLRVTEPGSWKLGQGPDFGFCSLPGIRVIIPNWQAWGLGEREPIPSVGSELRLPQLPPPCKRALGPQVLKLGRGWWELRVSAFVHSLSVGSRQVLPRSQPHGAPHSPALLSTAPSPFRLPGIQQALWGLSLSLSSALLLLVGRPGPLAVPPSAPWSSGSQLPLGGLFGLVGTSRESM